MTVKGTLEFLNVDAAIVALGKLTKAADTVMAPEGPRKERKGRNDKGKPRGAQAPVPEAKGTEVGAQQGVAPQSGIPDAASTAAPAAASVPAASAPPAVDPVSAGPVPAEADAQKALEKLFEAAPPIGGIESARAVMGRFGVTRLRDLPEAKRGEFIALAESVLAGGKP